MIPLTTSMLTKHGFCCCWNSWTHFVALKYCGQWAGWLLCKDRGCKKYTGSGLCNRAGKKLPNMLHSIPLICQLPPSVTLVSCTSVLPESMISDSVHWTMSLLSHKTWPGARSSPICQGPYHPTPNFQYPTSANQHLTNVNVPHNAIFSSVGDWMIYSQCSSPFTFIRRLCSKLIKWDIFVWET